MHCCRAENYHCRVRDSNGDNAFRTTRWCVTTDLCGQTRLLRSTDQAVLCRGPLRHVGRPGAGRVSNGKLANNSETPKPSTQGLARTGHRDGPQRWDTPHVPLGQTATTLAHHHQWHGVHKAQNDPLGLSGYARRSQTQ
jgi:hypothetical protein